MLKENGYLLTYEEFCAKYGFQPMFTEFCGIKRVIQKLGELGQEKYERLSLPYCPNIFIVS